MNHLHLTSKIHDVVATASAGGVVAVALSDIDLVIKIIVGCLTSVFLLMGIILRAREIRRRPPEP